ncbi:response regulator [Hymenobacter sp. BT18]|uniref:hybrid sensor histidine kinase/response regulator n=1 Tax=Hymenobacter sp. BT18 TaxID=2835648 RepID=UPI00143E81C7|nr:PAS domain-containing hybrid sensor histidine kinase/response regulator [Hymenobacter sp. BT18]QIX62476.1 response regulator [Hymenobacter sp. BT18]
MPSDRATLPATEASARIAELEGALREASARAAVAERRLASLADVAGPGLLLLNPDGTIHHVNEALCLLLALPEPTEHWAGKPADILFARLRHLALEPAQPARLLAALRTGQQPAPGNSIPLRDGRLLTQDYTPLPAPAGSARAELLSFRLLLPSPPAAPAAGAPGQSFSNDLVQYLPAPVVIHSAAGVILSCNQAFALLLQLPPDQLIGHSLSAFMPAAGLELVLPAYLAQVAARPAAAGVLPLLPRDGQPRELLYQAQRIGPADPAADVLLCGLDITERAQAEAELRRAKDKAEASGKAKEAFLANLSHEIRTPMNGVLGMARQLSKTRLNEDQQELLRIIQTSGEHLLSVLNEVLDMTKISSARLELEQVPFDLRASVEEALRPLAVQAREKGLAFHAALLEHSGPLPRVVGDAYRLNQVLINLTSNAIKFTPPEGSISVGGFLVSRTDTHLTVLFRLTDTGIGIAADKLDFIFEDFAQAGVDTARRYGGTGLGLGIARALVEQMGGALTVESQLGSGSTFSFTVTLPCAVGAEAVTRRDPPLDTSALRGRRVLVAEDNAINREVVRRLLESWGVVVDEAADGPAALALHAARSYDAILMDIQMPGLSGVEVTAALRRHPDPARAQVPVLALTANAFRSDLDRYLQAGIDDCLTKPFKEAEFFRKLLALVHPAEVPLYNLAEVHEMADGDAVFTARMVRSFLEHMPPIMQQIQTAAAAGQWPQVARLVHHIKPNLVQFGVAGLERALQLLMQVPKPGAKVPAGRVAAVRQLVRQVERVLASLPEESETL